MMSIRHGLSFVKMHGIGNDYVFLDAIGSPLPERLNLPALARLMSDRHQGVGSDGLIIIRPVAQAETPLVARMEMYNADGSVGSMCGNGLRCVASYVVQSGHVLPGTFGIATDAGNVSVTADGTGDEVHVDMGTATFGADAAGAVADVDVATLPGDDWHFVSVGNPHAIRFSEIDDNSAAHFFESIGPVIESHPIFPDRINVHMVDVVTSTHLRLISWERGSGATQACGTGATAAAAAAVRAGHCRADTPIRTSLPGGDLTITVGRTPIARGATDALDAGLAVSMAGPATFCFTGVWCGPLPH